MNKLFPLNDNNSLNSKNHKLFCFHYAGGTALTFKAWLPFKDIEISPVELPGKGARRSENYIRNCEELVSQIAEGINAVTQNCEFSLFGHSMGALLAFKLAHLLEIEYNKRAEKLFVACVHSPMDIDKYKVETGIEIDKETVVQELKRLNRISKEIQNNDKIMSILSSSIQDDCYLLESFDYKEEIINISIVAHAATDDTVTNREQMERWRHVTTQNFRIKEFEGDHYFLYDLGEKYCDELVK